jgi:hypothetical protein
MKEPIQQSGQDVSIVIYDAPLPPRYLRFSKKFIKTIFFVIPLTLGLIIITLSFLGINRKIQQAPTKMLPSIVSDDSKLTDLESEVKSLRESNQLLQNKLATQVTSENNQEEPFLLGIKKPYGMQNLISETKVSLDQFEFASSADKVNFKFQIINTDPESKVSGHIIVFMISNLGVIGYPDVVNNSLNSGIKFSMGEPFAVSRLRPTNAEFVLKPTVGTVKFLVYIFSREGDLLQLKETESYNLSGK